MRTAAAQDSAAPHRLAVYLGCAVLALAVNFLLGADMSSDTLSYHLYAGFSALHDRFSQDYFPAGPQSYFNPYVYVPFYWLVSHGLSSLQISSSLALVHSVMLWLTYELAVSVCPSQDERRRLKFGLCAVAFAIVNPILLQQIGSSYADITSGEFVLAGWLLLALAVRSPTTARVVYAGLVCGIATGLKLTNAVHAIAGFAVLLLLPLSLGSKIRRAFAYGLSLGIGFLVIAAPWSYRLEARFGNPVFPLMNNVFRSPEYTTESAQALRFIPATAAEALWRPFAMIDPVTMVHEELRAPDMRYAVLLLLAVAIFCRWLWRRRSRRSRPPLAGPDAASARAQAALGCGLAVDWVAWLGGSGNSRYFLPMSSIAAVVVVALLFRLLPAHPRVRLYAIAGILAIQGVQLWMGADYRWNPAPWKDHWLDITMPAKLASEPALYLTMGAQTNSFIAPYLAPGAGLINLSGLYTLSPNGATGARVKALIQRYMPHVRMLIRGKRLYREDELRTPTRAQIDDALLPFGLQIDETDCKTIVAQGLPPDLEFITTASKQEPPPPRDTTYLLSCFVTPDRADHSAQTSAWRATDLALDHLEDACPALFQPRRQSTEYSGVGGLRRYGGTDVVAWVSHGTLKVLQASVGGDIIDLGPASEWAKRPIRLRCGRCNGRAFARLAESAKEP